MGSSDCGLRQILSALCDPTPASLFEICLILFDMKKLGMTSRLGLAMTGILILTGCAGGAGVDGSSTQTSTGSSTDENSNGSNTTNGMVSISEPVIIEVLSANDVDDSVTKAIEESLDLAAEMWGLYWPVEYWVLGLDPDAGLDHVAQFCQRRDTRGEWNYDECMQREAGDEQHSMIEYQQLGAQAFAEGSAFGTAGRNGTAEWGIHRFATTLPWGLAGMMGIPGAEDVKTVFHEYWHAVQHSFITALDRDARDDAMGPVWFVEGSAEFMAQYATGQIMEQGTMPEVPAGDWQITYESQMKNKLFDIDNSLSGECAGRTLTSIMDYSDECSGLGYGLGAWGVAYLVSQTSPDVLLNDFHPVVESLGFEEAFEQAFGMSLEEFNDEFMDFIVTASESEKLAMLPRP